MGYSIGGVISQLASETSPDGVVTKADLSQWYPVALFSRKTISAETQYKIHDGEFLAIVEALKTWRHYLESCKYEVFDLTDHNNLCRFMDKKSLNSRQDCWAQELSRYYFWIDYCQGKANAVADTLSKFLQKSQDKKKELRAENGRIFYRLQNSLTSANLASLSAPPHLYQVLICGIYVLSQLRQFWNGLQKELAQERPYVVGGMRLRLHKLQAKDEQAQKTRTEHPKGWDNINSVLHYQGLPYVPKIIRTELISRHHDNLLASHFGMEKTCELIAQKYYWPMLRHDVENFIKGCDICLASKAIHHKPYGDLHSLPVPIHRWKDLSMDFITGLTILTD